MSTVTELAGDVGVSLACRAFSLPRSTFYRWSKPATGHQQPRPRSARALSRQERGQVYEVLCSDRFVDASPAETAATLLDEGVYLCSERTMYRVAWRRRRASGAAPAPERFVSRPPKAAGLPMEVWINPPSVCLATTKMR